MSADRMARQTVVDALAQTQFSEKKWVWVAEKEEGYIPGWIIQENGDDIVVEFPDGKKKKMSINDTEKMNPPKFDRVEDMADLTYLNEASVVHNLKLRYSSNMIYTYSGLFLVAINPYKKLPIYGEDAVKGYKGKKRSEMAPHIFAVADNAYNDMLQDKENQSILITGESGAGKTENTKKVIQYMASIACSSKGKLGTLEQQILEANPILESFGNAQTVRNNNSSRFGKFIRLEFNPTGHIVGANIERYLLEKSRVTHQTNKERNYHIFYQLMKGAPEEMKKTFLLDGTLNDYTFTKNSRKDIELVDDAVEFRTLVDAMNIMKISTEEQSDFFRIVAAVLHMGNIQVVADREDQAQLTEKGQRVVEKLCHVLGIPVPEFTKSLLKPKIKAGKDWVVQARDVSQVLYSVEALARATYERMFSSLVERINQAIGAVSSKSAFIGVLDIAGFEIFEKNSFEQLCINYTNEKLQQFFNHHMFIIEQQEYKKEGIEWKFIDFGLDLQPTIDLIEKTTPIGVLSCLDEECVMPKANDKTFIEKLNGLWKGKSSKFEVPRFNTGFILQHYAGKVEYDTTSWLDKNKDPLNENVTRLLAFSSEKYIANLFSDFVGEYEDAPAKNRGIIKRGAFRTVAQRHKEQLNSLMTQLFSTEPHFVRCIIPNNEKKSGKIDISLVLDQLRCNGVLEGIRICRAGFPNRLTFGDFRQRYELLAPNVIPKGFMDGRSGSQLLLDALSLDKNQYKIGTSKVFFKTGVLAELEEQRDIKLTHLVIRIQTLIRGHLARKLYKKRIDQFRAIKIIQRNARIYVTLREWSWWKLYTKVKPLLNVTRTDEELRKRDELIKEWQDKAKKEQEERLRLENLKLQLETENHRIENLLLEEKHAAADQAEILLRTQRREVDLNELLTNANAVLEEKESENESLSKLKSRLQVDLRDALQNLDVAKRNAEKIDREKSLREEEIKNHLTEARNAAALIEKLQAEKRAVETQFVEIQSASDRYADDNSDLNRTIARLKDTISDLEEKVAMKEEDLKRSAKKQLMSDVELQKLSEHLADTARAKSDLETTSKRKEMDFAELQERFRMEQSERAATEQARKDLLFAVNAAKSDLDAERVEREKIVRSKKKLEEELEYMTRTIEEKGSEESKQVELRKLRESELNDLKNQLALALQELETSRKTSSMLIDKLKVDLDSSKTDLALLARSKSTIETQLSDAKDEIDRAEDYNARLERARKQLEQDLSASVNMNAELELQLNEVKLTRDGCEAKLVVLNSRLDALESDASRLEREKGNVSRQLESLKDDFEGAVLKASSLESQKKRISTELADAKAQLQEEETAKADLTRKLLAKGQEFDALKERLGAELAEKSTELDETRKRLERELDSATQKAAELERNAGSLEKAKSRLSSEVEDLRLELDRSAGATRNADKMAKGFENQLSACNALLEEERRQRETLESSVRKLQAQLNSTKVELDEKYQQFQSVTKSKQDLEVELKALIDEFGDKGKNLHELDKAKRRLESRISDLEALVEDERSARINAEDQRLVLETAVSEHKKRFESELTSKDMKMDETRRMLMKEVNSLGEQLDDAIQQKTDILKQKKKLEDMVEEMSSKVENSAKGQSDLEKAKRRAETVARDLQNRFEESDKNRQNAEELASRHEKRANFLQSEVERFEVQFEQVERAKKQLEKKVDEISSSLIVMEESKASLVESICRLEKENQSLHMKLEEVEEARVHLQSVHQSNQQELARNKSLEALEDKLETVEESRRALLAAQRLTAQELDDKTKDILNLEKQKRLLHSELDDLKIRLESEVSAKCEEAAARRKLAGEIKDLLSKLDAETAKSADLSESLSIHRTKAELALSKLEAAELSRIKAEKNETNLRIQIKEMEQNLNEIAQDRRIAEDRVRAAEEKLSDLQEKQEEEAIELADLASGKRRLQEEIQLLLERQRRDSEDRDAVVEQTRKKYQKELKELSAELEAEKAAGLKLKESNKDLVTEVDSLSNRVEMELRQNISWKREKERIESKIEDLSKAYAEALAGHDESSIQIQSLMNQVKTLKASLGDLEAQKLILEKSKKMLEDRLEEAGEHFSRAEKARTDLSKSVLALDQKTVELNEAIEDHQDQAQTAAERARKAEQALFDVHAELSKERDQNMEHEKAKLATEKQLKELNSRILDLETSTLQSSSGANRRLELRIEEVLAQLNSEIQEKNEALKNVRRLDRATRELQFQIGEKDKMRQRFEEEADKLDQKIKRMKQQVEELETSESNSQLAKRRSERECDEYREKVLRLEKENEKLRLRLERPF